MSVSARNNNVPAIWAKNANTTIPNPPVVGLGYRNTALSNAIIEGGQLYKSLGDSAAWNQYLYELSSVAQAAEVYGIMPYSGITAYKDRSLTLYTDGKLYRAKSDVPVGTPCTDATYWELYVPDGVQVSPPITASAGVTLYVDYSKSTSGDGLTAASAFKNFTECFAAVRAKFAAANGIFVSAEWLPLFTIIATSGSSSQTIEPGDWRFQQLGVEIRFQKAFTLNSDIYVQGCVTKFSHSGSGSLTVKGAFVGSTSDITIDCPLTVTNASTTTDDGAGSSFRNCDLTINVGKTYTIVGTKRGLRVSGCSINVYGTLAARSTSGSENHSNTLIASDVYLSGTVTLDSSSGLASTMVAVQNSVIRNSGSFRARYMELIGSTVINVGTLSTGSQYAPHPVYGIVLRGSNFVNQGGTLGQLGSYDPGTKGAATVGGFVAAGALQKNQWPGTAAWITFGNGAYYND